MSSPATGTDETTGGEPGQVSAEEWEAAQAGRSRGLSRTCRLMVETKSRTKVRDRLTKRSAPVMRRVSGAGVPRDAAPGARHRGCERKPCFPPPWALCTRLPWRGQGAKGTLKGTQGTGQAHAGPATCSCSYYSTQTPARGPCPCTHRARRDRHPGAPGPHINARPIAEQVPLP